MIWGVWSRRMEHLLPYNKEVEFDSLSPHTLDKKPLLFLVGAFLFKKLSVSLQNEKHTNRRLYPSTREKGGKSTLSVWGYNSV